VLAEVGDAEIFGLVVAAWLCLCLCAWLCLYMWLGRYIFLSEDLGMPWLVSFGGLWMGRGVAGVHAEVYLLCRSRRQSLLGERPERQPWRISAGDYCADYELVRGRDGS
jgi:hypothetical protein